MEKNPLVSIIVPIYNVERRLEICLKSILAQTYKNVEIILVDDGSPDNCGKICDQYATKDARIKVIHQKNGGLSSARNTGIKGATGKYLMFVDSDDVLLKDALSYITKNLQSNDVDVAVVMIKEFNEDLSKEVITHSPFDYIEEEKINALTILDEMYDKTGLYVTLAQTKIVKREYIIKNDLYFTEGIYHEDDDFIARLYLTNPKMTFISKEIYGYRHRDNSIISTQDKSKIIKKAKDKIFIASRVFENDKVYNYPKMLDYFLTYFMGAYLTNLKNGGEKVMIPFNVFRKAPSKKLRLLGKLRLIVGYFLAKKLFEKFLLGRGQN